MGHDGLTHHAVGIDNHPRLQQPTYSQRHWLPEIVKMILPHRQSCYLLCIHRAAVWCISPCSLVAHFSTGAELILANALTNSPTQQLLPSSHEQKHPWSLVCQTRLSETIHRPHNTPHPIERSNRCRIMCMKRFVYHFRVIYTWVPSSHFSNHLI